MDVGTWLRGFGLGHYEQAFRDNDVDAHVLSSLTAEDLKDIGVVSVGHRRLILQAIAVLCAPSTSDDPVAVTAEPATPQAMVEPTRAERRRLTVMFADLVGSTALSVRLDPEEMREVLRAYQNKVTGEIARVDGHVAKLMGDGVLAYFGWPRSYEDEAERAVRAGLAIIEAVGKLCSLPGEPLAARVGIATGLVVVGDLVGEGTAREEAVVGETPNLAARLQGAAAPGTVVIAEGTRRLLGEVFTLRDLGPYQLKGFARPVTGFEVLGERPAGSRFEARRPGVLPPLVGRDEEFALLHQRWRQAVAGEGQAVLVVGEAGIGKSRLVRATLDMVEGEEHTVLRYQCSPYHTGTALWPVALQLASAAGLETADTEVAKVDKLLALLRKGANEADDALPLMAALLGVDVGKRYPAPDLTPLQRRTRTLAVLLGQLLGLAHQGPLLMVIEDTHWADPTTLELVGQALDRIGSASALILLTSRPDNQPSLGGHPRVNRLILNRLGRGPIEAIVARLASDRGLPAGVVDEIAARTDGVPLYVEELTKAVLEAGTAGAAVPESLHASLMARLDRVPEAKAVAQIAACIGREFAYPLLRAVSPLPEAELRTALSRLAAAELVFGLGEPPGASYAFKHALVRDAAHESLLKSERQRLHACIVRSLEEHFPETADVEPELLARHCTEAGLGEQAVEYWQRAGQRALARSAMAEAAAQLATGLTVLASLPGGIRRQRRELGLQLALGQASLAAKGFAAPETGRAYARASELCRELGEVPEFFPALYGRFIVHFQRAELAAAHQAAEELLRSAGERNDAAAQVTGHRIVGSALYHLGRLADSRDHLEKGLALYQPERDRSSASVYALDTSVVCSFWLVHVLLAQGYPDQAQVRMKHALAYARELAHPYTLAYALSVACILHGRHRPGAEAQAEAESLIALATEQGFPLPAAVGTVVAGWASVGEEPAEEAIARIRRGLAGYTGTGAELWVPDILSLLAQANGRVGRPADALELLAEALDRVDRTGGRWLEAELHRLRGELLLALPDPDPVAAEADFSHAITVARQQGARMWELRAAMGLARLWRDQSRLVEAHDLVAPICAWFTEGFDTPDLRDARALLGELR